MKALSEKTSRPEGKETGGKLALKRGSYSMVLSLVVLAILVVVNIFVSVLPKNLTKLDISAQKLYSITSSTKVVVNNLQKDVTIYWIVQAEQEDSILENLLEKYDSLSQHITVEKKNPDVYPQFAAQYTDETVSNNSLIVVCGTKSRYIPFSDIYLSDIDYNTYTEVKSFDGEGLITSAIDYVISDDLPIIYVLEGHGETELPAYLTKQIEKDNMVLQNFSLLNEDEIPEDASCILIHDPQSDISPEEADILLDYIQTGGKVFVLAGPVEDGILTNLFGLLSDYGITPTEGIVIEGDRNYYAFQQPYVLLPEINASDITDPLIESHYYMIVPTAVGLKNDGSASGIVTELLTTSYDSYSKTAGFALETYDREDGDIDGPFALAVSINAGNDGALIFVGSGVMLDETVNAYSSGANLDFCMNALSALVGENEAVAIRSKSLGYNYLTISESTSTALKAVMIGVIPALFAIAGVTVLILRRRKKNAQA